MKKIRLISSVGVRDKCFLNYHKNGIYFDEAIELSLLLSGRTENNERCKWINQIIIPDNFNDFFKIIKKNTYDITLIYLGRKNIDLSILKNILLIIKQGKSTVIVVNEKKFIRLDSINVSFKMFVKELISRLICKMNFIFKSNFIDYFIFNSYSANFNIFTKFNPSINIKSSFFDFDQTSNNIKIKDKKKNIGIYLDSYDPFTERVIKKYGTLPTAKEYYGRIISFLHEQKKIRKLDEIFIYLHPNSKGLERNFFKDFHILERSEYSLQDLSFCKLCWSPGSDALITLAMSGVETIVITNINFPKPLIEYHVQKSKMLNSDCIDISSDTKLNHMNRRKSNNLLKKLFDLQFDHQRENASIIVKKIIKNLA